MEDVNGNGGVRKESLLNKILNMIEAAGNKLPHPVMMFLGLAIIVVIASGICGHFGVKAIHPGTKKEIEVVNLLSKSGFRRMFSNVVTNYANFPPFGMVMVTVIGSAAAEKSGFLISLMQKVMSGAKPAIVTFLILLVGINANLAGDAGFIIMPALAAVIYLGIGRHPLLGMYVAFAGVAAGFCANIFLGMSDALAYGFTESAAKMINPDYSQSPAINWYFLIVSTFVLCTAGTLLVEKVLIHRFQTTKEKMSEWNNNVEAKATLTPEQNKGLKCAGIGFIILLLVIVSMCLGSDPLLGDPEKGGSLMSGASAFMKGIILIVTVMLLVPGVCYGFGSGKYKGVRGLIADITEGFKEMGGYVFICFFIAQFTSYFSWSNLGTIIAIKGAEGLQALKITGIPLLIGLIIVSCIINLFIGSASAKWAILAPIFVPLMMLMEFDPAVTQVAYRIGDSITNPISPLFSYMPILLGYAHKYDKNVGVGTIIANMIPFSFTFAIIWTIQLIIWVMLNLPLGIGGKIYL
ncbi:AbgT family transporter [Fusobacterium sp. PH5-44]|uniref:AbgT family transporter n=1 Tax=unclassified Fusobacterium TaxID=2648384 RepID=UPI003D24938E